VNWTDVAHDRVLQQTLLLVLNLGFAITISN